MRTLIFAMIAAIPALAADPPRFERVVIDADFPGGYQVEVADVDGDKKPDIVALGGSTLAWYQNPSWKKRVVSTAKQTPDVISSATADLDGDGKAEIAIAYDFSMNEPNRGKLLLAIPGATPDDPWTFKPIALDRTPRTTGAVPIERGAGGAGGFGGGGSGPLGPEMSAGRVTNPIAVVKRGDAQESPGQFPSIHRLRWGPYPVPRVARNFVDFEKKLGLFVAPLFGPSAKPPAFAEEPAVLILLEPGLDPLSANWRSIRVGDLPVLHAIDVVDHGDAGGFSTILGASNLGVTEHRIVGFGMGSPYRANTLAPGSPGVAPKTGASEVHLGRFKDGRNFVATVEPWHGTDVAIYAAEAPESGLFKPTLKLGPRVVIDSTLKEGHALWVADADGDGDDEVFAGYRGGTGGVLIYDFDGKDWNRSVLDPDVTAQDLRGGDIDGDGTPDVVAIGGRSHNVVWYRPIRPAK